MSNFLTPRSVTLTQQQGEGPCISKWPSAPFPSCVLSVWIKDLRKCSNDTPGCLHTSRPSYCHTQTDQQVQSLLKPLAIPASRRPQNRPKVRPSSALNGTGRNQGQHHLRQCLRSGLTVGIALPANKDDCTQNIVSKRLCRQQDGSFVRFLRPGIHGTHHLWCLRKARSRGPLASPCSLHHSSHTRQRSIDLIHLR